ncbi:MAG: hypothetical protein ACRC1K_08870, partial [Planctomycetia bacterium]
EEAIDQLECDRLVLQFRDQTPDEAKLLAVKAPPAADPAAVRPQTAGKDRKLQTVTATGEKVILISQSQKLQAFGNYLYHDADARRAVITGEKEMIAVQDNTTIHARSLILDQAETRGVRKLTADGPDGWMEIVDADKPTETGDPELTVRWQERLTMVTLDDGVTKMVTITKDVELENKKDALRCDLLKVWLKPQDGGGATATASQMKPVQVDARGHVEAGSKDMTISTESLVMHIRYREKAGPGIPPVAEGVLAPVVGVASAADVAAPPALAAKTAPPSTKDPTATPPAKLRGLPVGDKPTPAATIGAPVVRAKPADAPPAGAAADENPAMDVKARYVAVVVERDGEASHLDRAWADGEVLVVQAPRNPKEDPVEIVGHQLEFRRKPVGDYLKVYGSDDRWASVKTTEMTLVGKREVVLDEISNAVAAAGRGHLYMHVESELTGKKADQKKPVRIDFNDAMDFDGKVASFEGGVKAKQENSQIESATMDVTLENRMIFRDARIKRAAGDRKPPARIAIIDCDKDVVVFEDLRDPAGAFLRTTTTYGSSMHFNNLDRTARVQGPGSLHVVERAEAKKDENGKLKKPDHNFDLTRVQFLTEMRVDNAREQAQFFDDVDILHAPIMRLDEEIDPDRLPADGMTVKANDNAVMGVTKRADGKNYRDFQAVGNVR